MKYTVVTLIYLFLSISCHCIGQGTNDYLKVIKEQWVEPVEFVQQKLKTHGLVIFDDGLHHAVEPFKFYQKLVRENDEHFNYIFVEVFGINNQPLIDQYLREDTKDSTLLLKVFQDNFGGLGWRYETYYDLLSAVWDFNHSNQDPSRKIEVVAVDQPIYWEGIHAREDYNIFQKSLIGRDYFMYKTILEYMEGFKGNKKGIFLTNTRHAYKHIKDSEGNYYWNCGTFFNQWHPEETYAIRLHNATLFIEAERTGLENGSTDGLDRLKYSWVKMDNGLWDEAFEANKNQPVAIPLQGNAFGQTKYIGNHMLNAEQGQTMLDAYDALVFLAPINDLYFSPKMSFIYSESFKKELERRLKILYRNDMDGFLSRNNVETLNEYIEELSKYQPKSKNELIGQ